MAGFLDETRTGPGAGVWNAVDPIVKEASSDSSGPQGNHGDVARIFVVPGRHPDPSWDTWRYHYPQWEPPIAIWSPRTPARRTGARVRARSTPEPATRAVRVVTVDYAKAAAQDLVMRITVENAGPDEATLTCCPPCGSRDTWSWAIYDHPKPTLRRKQPRGSSEPQPSGPLVMAGDGTPEALSLTARPTTPPLFGATNTTRTPRTGSTTTRQRRPHREPARRGKGRSRATGHGASRRFFVIEVRLVGDPHPALNADPTEPRGSHRPRSRH